MAVLLEALPFDPAAGSVRPIRATDIDDVRVTALGGNLWLPALLAAGTIASDGYAPAYPGWGETPEIMLQVSLAAFPGASALDWPDRQASLYVDEPGTPWPWVPRFSGLVSSAAAREGALQLRLRADDAWCDRPILATTYAGTGGVEGVAALKGSSKPLAFGAPRLAVPVLLDPVEQIYQLHGAGRIEGVVTLLDRLVRYGTPATDVASYTLLLALPVAAGRYATCLAEGLVKLGAPPEGPLTAILKGDAAGGHWYRLPGEIIGRIAGLAGAGAGQIDSTSLAALDAACPYPISRYLSGGASARSEIGAIAASCNAMALIGIDGRLRVVRAALTAPAADIATDGASAGQALSAELASTAAPYWRLQIGAEPVFRVHDYSEIAYTAELIDRGDYDPLAVYREGNIVSWRGGRYLYQNPTPTAGNPPPDPPVGANSWWQRLSVPASWGDIIDDGGKPLLPGLREDWLKYAAVGGIDQAWIVSPVTKEFRGGDFVGGRAVQLHGAFTAISRARIGYDPEDLYRVRARFYASAAGAGSRVYVGVAAYDASGNLVSPSDAGTNHYPGGSKLIAAGSWWQAEGFFRGRATVGAGNSVGAGAGNPSQPSPLASAAVTFAPLFLAENPAGGTSIVACDYIEVEKVDDLTPLPPRAWLAIDVQQRGQLVTYLGRTWIAIVQNQGVAPPATSTGNATWGLVSDAVLPVDGVTLSDSGGALQVKNDGVDTQQLAPFAAGMRTTYRSSGSLLFSGSLQKVSFFGPGDATLTFVNGDLVNDGEIELEVRFYVKWKNKNEFAFYIYEGATMVDHTETIRPGADADIYQTLIFGPFPIVANSTRVFTFYMQYLGGGSGGASIMDVIFKGTMTRKQT